MTIKVILFDGGWTNAHDKASSPGSSVVTDELKGRTGEESRGFHVCKTAFTNSIIMSTYVQIRHLTMALLK